MYDVYIFCLKWAIIEIILLQHILNNMGLK
jgi:hypothetical protein